MFSKKLLTFFVAFLGVVFAASVCFGSSGDIEWPGCWVDNPVCDEESCEPCEDGDDFTKEFPLKDCRYFKTIGKNLYFKLIPGYKLVLETPEGEEDRERAEITVLWKKKRICIPGIGCLRTRVVEERAYELEEEDGEVEETLIEISLNWFAICKKTNAVYYFGEDSRECDNGFTDDELMCEPEEDDGEPTDPDTTGSWEAGVAGAMPGMIMPGTPLLGAKYCQEQAPSEDPEETAVDRGEHVEDGLTWPLEEDLEEGEEPDFTSCIMIVDTNPAEGVCDADDGDEKIYCPGVGLVKDEDLELVEYGYERYRPWCRSRRYR